MPWANSAPGRPACCRGSALFSENAALPREVREAAAKAIQKITLPTMLGGS